jgi:hypothetical protein
MIIDIATIVAVYAIGMISGAIAVRYGIKLGASMKYAEANDLPLGTTETATEQDGTI